MGRRDEQRVPCLAASRDVAPSARTKAPRHVSSTPQGCVQGPCSHHSPCISSPQEGKRLPRCYYFPNTVIPSTLAAPPGKRWPSPAAEVTERPSTVSAFRLRRSARLFLVFLIFLCFVFVTFPQGGTIILIFKNKKIEVQEDYALVQPHPWHRARMRFAPRRSGCRSEARERSSPFFNYIIRRTRYRGEAPWSSTNTGIPLDRCISTFGGRRTRSLCHPQWASTHAQPSPPPLRLLQPWSPVMP